MYKYLTIILLLVMASQGFAQSGWVIQKSGTTSNLRGISSRDGINAVAVGVDGVVTSTSNQGRPWIRQQSIYGHDLNAVTCIGPKTYIAVGPTDSIFRTTDRGVNWMGYRSWAYGECWTVWALHQLHSIDYDTLSGLCAAAGDAEEVVYSLDSGITWEQRMPQLQPGSSMTHFHGLSLFGGTALAVGEPWNRSTETGLSNIFISRDEGDGWIKTTSDKPGISPFDNGQNQNGCDTKAWIIVGDKGTILHSRDYGITWDSIPSFVTENLNAVKFSRDSLNGYIAGDNGVILYTNDGGFNWVREKSPTTQNLHSVTVSDPFHAFICGDSGIILWTQDGGFSGVRSSSGEVAMEIQAYPNPIVNQTTIQIFLQQSRQLNLHVFNALGEEVTQIARGIYDQGSHSFTWDASRIPSGVYLCALESEGQTIYSRMVVMK